MSDSHEEYPKPSFGDAAAMEAEREQEHQRRAERDAQIARIRAERDVSLPTLPADAPRRSPLRGFGRRKRP